MAKKRDSEPTFREARERLDEILEELVHEAADVDQLASRVREASELIRFCRARLAAARQEVTEVVASLAAEGSAASARGAGAGEPDDAADDEDDPEEADDAGDDGRPPDLPF